MADEPKADPAKDALMFLGFLAILVMLWLFAGGPGKTDLRGLFLSPPQPLGTGEAYGPQFGGASSTPTVEAPPSVEAPTY
jgi:hypothetical protein